MLNLSKVFRFYTNNRSLSALYIFADRLYLTIVDEEPEAADTFFPEINPDEWEVAEKEMRNENDLSFTFLTLYRKQ